MLHHGDSLYIHIWGKGPLFFVALGSGNSCTPKSGRGEVI